MDLNTIETILRPETRGALPDYGSGDAMLGGGTWLFSEPQPHLRRLIDLTAFGWPAIVFGSEGVEIAATCTLAQLDATAWPQDWRAAALVGACCRALLGSFKIWNTATVGGNICLALPAGPMTALAAALDGICVIWTADGGERTMPVTAFVRDDRVTALAAGEILRAVRIGGAAMRRRTAFRQHSLTRLGRSAALLIGTCEGEAFTLTITAATTRPIVRHFETAPSDRALSEAIDAAVPAWFDDVHGAPDWRRHLTHHLAREIVAELFAR